MADDDTLDPAARLLDLDAGIAQIVAAVEQARAYSVTLSHSGATGGR